MVVATVLSSSNVFVGPKVEAEEPEEQEAEGGVSASRPSNFPCSSRALAFEL